MSSLRLCRSFYIIRSDAFVHSEMLATQIQMDPNTIPTCIYVLHKSSFISFFRFIHPVPFLAASSSAVYRMHPNVFQHFPRMMSKSLFHHNQSRSFGRDEVEALYLGISSFRWESVRTKLN